MSQHTHDTLLTDPQGWPYVVHNHEEAAHMAIHGYVSVPHLAVCARGDLACLPNSQVVCREAQGKEKALEKSLLAHPSLFQNSIRRRLEY